MRIFEYTKHKFDNGSEKTEFYIHPVLSILILMGALMGVITTIKVVFEAFV